MKRNTSEQFIMKAKQLHGDKYDYSKLEYVNSRENVCIICPIHGEFLQRASNHLLGRGCPKCALEEKAKKRTLSTIQFIEKAKQVHGSRYNYDKVKYINSETSVIITCPIHGDFYQNPSNHIHRQAGCPHCKSSKGEKLIEEILIDQRIKYQRQYPIPIDININRSGIAYVDFYLPELNIFIEYNGIQHFIPIEHFGGELRLVKQQKRDQAIRDYCAKNNIQLLEINYNNSELEIINLIKRMNSA